MARLAAQEKGEFYPTPLPVADAIGNALVVEAVKNKPLLRLCDPCCGTGEPLARIATILRQHTTCPVQTWGVEINASRAAEAATRLDVVLEAPFEVTAVKPSRWGVASLLWLNPPYDFSSTGYRRMETAFLERATPTLETGGLLAYLVPPAALDWQSARLLSEWYGDISVYRFPDGGGLFEQFHQVVVFGRRLAARDRRRAPDGLLRELSDSLYRDVVGLIREKVPQLTALTPLTIPTAREHAELCRGSWTLPEIVAKVESDPRRELAERLGRLYAPQETLDLQPLVSPKRGHIAQVLASGLMGTLAFAGEILKGRAVKVRELVEETVELNQAGDEVDKKRYKDRYTTHIVRVTPAGLEHLSAPETVQEFLQDNADRLAGVLQERLRPYGDGVTPQEEAILAQLSPYRTLPGRSETGLFPSQKETAVAAVRALRRHGVCHVVAECGYGKTTCGLAVAELMAAYPALVVCPPHLVDKWAREAEDVIPGAHPVIIESIGQLQATQREHRPGDRLLVIVSRTRIKLGPGWKPAVPILRALPDKEEHPQERQRFAEAVAAYKAVRQQWLAARRSGKDVAAADESYRLMVEARRAALGKAIPLHTCPGCGQPVVDGQAIKDDSDLARQPHKCPNTVEVWDEGAQEFVKVACGRRSPGQRRGGTPLWQSDNDGHRRWPLADYIVRQTPGFFRLFTADECFPGDTPVSTPAGPVPIQNIRAGDRVLSWKDGRLVVRRVVRIIVRPRVERLVRVTHAAGRFTCTPNHKVYVDGETVRADRLRVGDRLTVLGSDGNTKGVHDEGAGLSGVRQAVCRQKPLSEGHENAPEVLQPAVPVPGAAAVPGLQALPDLRDAVPGARREQAQGAADLQPLLRREAQGEKGQAGAVEAEAPPAPDLRAMWQRVRAAVPVGAASLLFQELRASRLPSGASGSRKKNCSHPQKPGGPRAQLQADEGAQPFAQPSRQRAPGGGPAPSRVRRDARWQRAHYTPAARAGRTVGDGLGHRVSGPHGRAELARGGGGHRQPAPQDRRGGGRGFAQDEEAAGPGSPERAHAQGGRLDGAEVLERRGGQRHREGRCDHSTVLSVEFVDSRDEFVYNLEVEDTHCYFAAEVLVGNCHVFKAKDSDAGWGFGLLAGKIPWTLTLTGTFFGGPSTSIFWLLHRTQSSVRQAFPFHGEERWVAEYGVQEVVVKEQPACAGRRDGGTSHDRGRKRPSVTVSEKPGISPAIVRHILPTTVFRTLADLGMALPPFDDQVVYLEMSEEQQRDYRSVYNTCWQALLKYWPRYAASWLQWTLARPNSCFREETIALPDGDAVVVEPVVDVRAGELLPKEEWLQATVRAELAQNRRCLVYLRQTGTRDIRPRLVQVLGQAGIQAQVLNESIEPRRREAWLRKHNPPVLITNPKLIETGLDLVTYSTAIFAEPDYSLYTLWQACRRVWRLGQTQPVKVFYAVYTDAMEDLALRLIGQKMAAAQLLYGEDVAGAIVPDMDDNLVVQLVNAIKAGEHEQLKKVDGLFGNDDQATWSPVGSPTRISPPLVSWTEWLRAKGLRLEDVRPPRRRRPQATPPSGQMAFTWGV